jgi:N-acetyl-gamma-glutamyl-phosphate reductase
LKDTALYTRWYGGKHPAPKWLREAVYGLPESYRNEIRQARLVAAPGCYSTTSILAGLPLVTRGLLGAGPIIVDAKSGISGAGRKVEATYLFAENNESIQAYGLKGHRHHPEIVQEWTKAAHVAKKKTKVELIFVPHLIPMNRGIFATLYAPLARKMRVEALREMYLAHFLREPFVTILPPNESPEIKGVTYTNHCQIGVSIDPSGQRAVIMAVTDNLGKGASGQAVQCMNLMFGLEETTGLL